MQATTLTQVSGGNKISWLLISEHRNRVGGKEYSSHKEQEDERKETSLLASRMLGTFSLACHPYYLLLRLRCFNTFPSQSYGWPTSAFFSSTYSPVFILPCISNTSCTAVTLCSFLLSNSCHYVILEKLVFSSFESLKKLLDA